MKRSVKKLSLSRETLRRLEEGHLRMVGGAATQVDCSFIVTGCATRAVDCSFIVTGCATVAATCRCTTTP